MEKDSKQRNTLSIIGGKRLQDENKEGIKKPHLITILTATYNADKYLEKSILSVIKQDYHNFEYIIIDGGSTDNTLQIINKYKKHIDYWLSEKDGGIYEALNKGINVSRGEWIYVLGADDQMFNVLGDVALHLKDPQAVYYGNVVLKSSQKVFDGKFSRFKLMFKNISHQSMFYPNSYLKINKFNLRYKSASDYVLLMGVVKNNKYKLVHLPLNIAIYNDMEGVSSRAEDPVFLQDRKRLIKTHFPKWLYCIYCIRYYLVWAVKKALFLSVNNVF